MLIIQKLMKPQAVFVVLSPNECIDKTKQNPINLPIRN